MAIRVLCIFSRFYTGGVSKALSFVANSCYDAGMEVHCISISPQPETISMNPKIHRYVVELKENSTGFSKIINRGLFVFRLRRKIKKIKPDVIIVFRSDLVKMTVYVSWGLGIPIICSERGNPLLYGKDLLTYRRVYNRCSAAVFQTQAACDVFNVTCRSLIIPNPAVTRRQSSIMRSDNYREGENFVTASRLSKEKNIEGLLYAYSMIKNRINGKKLIIYGDGPQQDYLLKLSENLGLVDNVIFKGNVKDFTEDDESSSIFVLNTLSEGMPNALIEAMVAGYACICTDCPIGAPRWLSDNGRRVKLVPVKDNEALAAAMLEVSENTELRRSLSSNSKEIKDILDPARISEMWVSLVRSVCA